VILQETKRSLLEVRAIFDEMLKYYPSMAHHIAADGGIVHSPDFENAIVKVIDEDLESLKETEIVLLEPFR
jgi:hypothetical protein